MVSSGDTIFLILPKKIETASTKLAVFSLNLMSKPVNCRYFYGDYHRNRNVEKCRLIEANRESPRPWQRKLCDSCPVPELLIASNSHSLLLEGEVQRVLFRDRVKITFAVCSKHVVELDDPRHCPECAKE